jgi:ankyrin repeat protein
MNAISCLPNFFYVGAVIQKEVPVIKTIKLLLELGGNLNYKDENGCNCLWHACEIWNAEVVQLLLDAGASPDRNWRKESMLGYFRIAYSIDNFPTELRASAYNTIELLTKYSKTNN